MENNSILYGISKYIIKNIFSYVKNPIFRYKFFNYSKSFQKKIGIELVDYERLYIEKFGINFRDYLFSQRNIYSGQFNKNLYQQFLESDISQNNLDFNLVKKIIVDIYKKYSQVYKESEDSNENKENDALIDIYSPFFDDLSKMEFFQWFSIFISADIIGEYNLSNDYISIFEKLNKSNSKYTSITFFYRDSHDIDYLKEFKINFGQIKRFHLIIGNYFRTKDYDYFFKEFFSLNNLDNNLVVLDLNIKWMKFTKYQIETNLIEKINNFKSLEYLHINGLKLKNNFELNLCNLKTLFLEEGENFTFAEKSCVNLKELKLLDCLINHPKSLLEISNLDKLILINPKNGYYFSIFNFSSCKRLKNASMDPNDFIYLEDTLLNHVRLISNSEVDLDVKKKTFEKLIRIDTLKEIEFEFGKINDDEISLINGENTSVETIKINYKRENKDITLYNLEKKFPNLLELEIEADEYSVQKPNSKLEIKENNKCKIKQLHLDIGGYSNIKFCCQKFENLEEIRLELKDQLINLEEAFPFFNNKCDVIFKSLTKFGFITDYENLISIDILKNLYNNLNKMPNICYLVIDCIDYNVDKKFYFEFIKKILSLNLKIIYFSIRPDNSRRIGPYSKNDLIKIYPNIDFSKYDRIHINNFDNEENMILNLY